MGKMRLCARVGAARTAYASFFHNLSANPLTKAGKGATMEKITKKGGYDNDE